MIKKWFEIITDHRIGLRERMFRIVSSICMLALIFTLPMGRSLFNIVLLVVSLAAMALIVRLSIRKKRVHAGATAIAVLLLTLFPITFFSAGGFYSGVPEWFVLCFIYVCITLLGKRRIIFSGCAQRRRSSATASPITFRSSPYQIFITTPSLTPPFPWSWSDCSPASCSCS